MKNYVEGTAGNTAQKQNKTAIINTLSSVKYVSHTGEQSDINHPREFEKLERWQKLIVTTWINENFKERSSINYRHSSYEHKHTFERSTDGFYMTNGAFKGALLAAGFTNHNEGMNWCFAITEQSIRDAKRGGNEHEHRC